MHNEKVELLTDKFKNDISKNDLKELQDVLLNIPDEKYNKVEEVKVKSARLTTVLSALFGLFGVGSFYLGKLKLGIVKLVCNVILPLSIGLIFLLWVAPQYNTYGTQSQVISTALEEDTSYKYSLTAFRLAANEFSKKYDDKEEGGYLQEMSKPEDKRNEEKLTILIADMQTQLNKLTESKAYFNYIKDTLPNKTSNTVEKKISLKASLSNICELLDGIENNSDYASVNTKVNSIVNEITGIKNRAFSAETNYMCVHGFVSLFFTITLILDAIVILAYWINEIFRERKICYEINFDKINEAIK